MEPAHPKEDDEANQRRFGASATSWREELELSGGRGRGAAQGGGVKVETKKGGDCTYGR